MNREEIEKKVDAALEYDDIYDLSDIIKTLLDDFDEKSKKYYELLYAVESKYENETRHETALRYIKSVERGRDEPQTEVNS